MAVSAGEGFAMVRSASNAGASTPRRADCGDRSRKSNQRACCKKRRDHYAGMPALPGRSLDEPLHLNVSPCPDEHSPHRQSVAEVPGLVWLEAVQLP